MGKNDNLVLGLVLAGGAVGAAMLMARRAQDQGGSSGGSYGGGGPSDTTGGWTSYDPWTGTPIDPITGLPGTPGQPGTPGNPGTPGANGWSPNIQLTPEAEAALIKDARDTNNRIADDNAATNQAVRDAAAQQERDSTFNRNVNIAVGAGLLAASYKGIVSFGKGLVSGAAGIGRSIPAAVRSYAVSPSAPIIGGAVQGGLSIVQGAQDLQARKQGQGPYANIKSDAAAVTAATANTAAATAVGAGSLGLASLDFNRGVSFLGLPVVTTGSRPGRTRLFGQSWLEF